jgi:RNA polymerase sigma-70 factor (ECF subfamily)
VCLDALRARRSRRDDPFDALGKDASAGGAAPVDPEQEAELADSVGLAMLVVLETLAPAERLAFVLHDLFSVPFDEIASIIGRSPVATRQLASRARRQVKGGSPTAGADRGRQREVVDAFLAASRSGDFDALVGLLAPDVVLRADAAAVPPGVGRVARGASVVAGRALTASGRAQRAQVALIDGVAGVVVAPDGQVSIALRLMVRDGRIVGIDVVADPERLSRLDVDLVDD